MKPFLGKFTVVLLVAGFILPLLWIAAIFTGLFWVGAAEPGLREDGKRRSGGLLGGLWDEYIVDKKMMECPHCLALVFREASKCRHCGEWIGSQQIDTDTASITGEYRGYSYVVLGTGEVRLKLSTGEWRNFPSMEFLKENVDAIKGKV